MRTMILAAMIAGCLASTMAVGEETRPAHAHGGALDVAPLANTPSEVISLSDSEIADLRLGHGMGLARAAELNGHPGPAHATELADALALTPEQRRASEALRASVQGAARAKGARILAAEAALARGFARRPLDAASLKARVMALAALQGELRFIHLEAHLAERAWLSDAQVARYAMLRGYADSPAPSSSSDEPPHGHKH